MQVEDAFGVAVRGCDDERGDLLLFHESKCGGGKGAAIGATAGAGAGTGASAVGKGQQIILHPEQVIAFQLQNSLTVTPGVNRPAMNQ